jgi:hypothetical protein
MNEQKVGVGRRFNGDENTDRPSFVVRLSVCSATPHCFEADGVLVYNLETFSSLCASSSYITGLYR